MRMAVRLLLLLFFSNFHHVFLCCVGVQHGCVHCEFELAICTYVCLIRRFDALYCISMCVFSNVIISNYVLY